ncbi:unnamed protein product [Didymodactylos carnosus]|nr:unnamed protein product [Didymodactylos carnosus]CAF4081998.1 unnamed protein product [Didymodactylos carnosus]
MKAKVNELRSQVWMAAALSAGVAAIPVPGLALVCDQTILIRCVLHYKQQLALDDKSLKSIAALHSIPLKELEEQIQTIFSVYFFTDLSKMVLSLLESQAVGSTTEVILRFIPFIGPFVAAGISFGVTMFMLNKMLTDMEKAALLLIDVIKKRSVSSVDG